MMASARRKSLGLFGGETTRNRMWTNPPPMASNSTPPCDKATVPTMRATAG
jgi:hypothetical protein